MKLAILHVYKYMYMDEPHPSPTQVTKDGYGVSYIIPGDNLIYFHVSSFKSSEHTVSPCQEGVGDMMTVSSLLRTLDDLLSVSKRVFMI